MRRFANKNLEISLIGQELELNRCESATIPDRYKSNLSKSRNKQASEAHNLTPRSLNEMKNIDNLNSSFSGKQLGSNSKLENLKNQMEAHTISEESLRKEGDTEEFPTNMENVSVESQKNSDSIDSQESEESKSSIEYQTNSNTKYKLESDSHPKKQVQVTSFTPQPMTKQKKIFPSSNAKTVKPFDQLVKNQTAKIDTENRPSALASPEMNSSCAFIPKNTFRLNLLKNITTNTNFKNKRRRATLKAGLLSQSPKSGYCVLCNNNLHPIYESLREKDKQNDLLR